LEVLLEESDRILWALDAELDDAVLEEGLDIVSLDIGLAVPEGRLF
jgi:hypothetical protein